MTDKYADLWAPYQGAVSITFDDGRKSQLSIAVPMMDDYNIKGTFYLNTNTPPEHLKRHLEPWIEPAARGHEIGGHGMMHYCSNNFTGSTAGGGVEDISLDDIEADIIESQSRLVQLFPHQKKWSFAYPCYCTYVGKGPTRQSYVPVVARHYSSARAGGEFGWGNYPRTVDLHAVWSMTVNNHSWPELIGAIEDLTARGQWVVLCFHEVNGKGLTVASGDFEKLLQYLDRNRDRIWTGTFIEVAAKIREYQSGL